MDITQKMIDEQADRFNGEEYAETEQPVTQIVTPEKILIYWYEFDAIRLCMDGQVVIYKADGGMK